MRNGHRAGIAFGHLALFRLQAEGVLHFVERGRDARGVQPFVNEHEQLVLLSRQHPPSPAAARAGAHADHTIWNKTKTLSHVLVWFASGVKCDLRHRGESVPLRDQAGLHVGGAAAETGEAFRRAYELCQKLGDKRRIFPILIGLHGYHDVRAEHDKSTIIGQEALELARGETQHVAPMVTALFLRGENSFLLGELRQAVEYYDSLDEILTFCQSAEVITVVGPTAGFLPDPLFKRGVSTIGGSEIVDVSLAIARLRSEQGLGDAARKYILRPEDYAVAATLLAEK